jgi:hypothetical protein
MNSTWTAFVTKTLARLGLPELDTDDLREYDDRQPPGCWQWSGAMSGKYRTVPTMRYPRIPGYAADSNRGVAVHRILFIIARGASTTSPITRNCGNTRCVRPSHCVLPGETHG